VRVGAERLRVAFVALAALWATMLVLAPFVASRAHATAFGTAIVVAVYGVGGIVCHQLPARSFHLWAAQMPVCARCAGIYIGGAAAAVAALAARGRRRPRTMSASRARSIMAVSVAPTVATLLYEWSTGVTPAGAIRFVAGVPLGAAVAWLLVDASRNQVN
jgi:uncharacterized membrane protein